MVKSLLLIFFTFICLLTNAQQTSSEFRQVSVQNGVVNFETAGVEGFIAPQIDPVSISKPLSEWGLQECSDVLYYVNEKLVAATENNDQASMEYYQSYRDTILARIAVINNQTQGQ